MLNNSARTNGIIILVLVAAALFAGPIWSSFRLELMRLGFYDSVCHIMMNKSCNEIKNEPTIPTEDSNQHVFETNGGITSWTRDPNVEFSFDTTRSVSETAKLICEISPEYCMVNRAMFSILSPLSICSDPENAVERGTCLSEEDLKYLVP